MNKTLILTLFILLCATLANAQSYDKDKAEKDFRIKCGKNWNIVWNNVTDTPHYIFGSKCNVAHNKEKNIKDKEKIKKIFEDSARELKDFFNLNEIDLKPKRIEKGNNDWFVEYQQYYQDVPVEYATVSMTISNNGELLIVESNFRNDVSIYTVPSIESDKAVEIAKERTDFDLVDETIKTNVTKNITSTLVILPVKDGYELTWKITLYSSPSPQIHKDIFVNAWTGKIVKEVEIGADNFNIYGNINGYVYPRHPNDVPQLTSLSNLNGYVSILDYDPPYPSYFIMYSPISGGNSYNSGWISDDCRYNFDADSQTCADPFAGTELFGSYVRVINDMEGTYYKGSSGFYSNFAGSGQANINFPAGDETNCYYYANYIHSVFKGSPYNYNGMDYPLECHTSAGVANGHSDGTNIQFASYASSGQYWARSNGVIYHEYMHSVIYHLYNSFIAGSGWSYQPSSEGAAMDEGLADYFSAAINNDAIIGSEFPGINRNLDTGSPLHSDPANYANYDFSNNGGTPYKNAMIISGTLWDIRKAIGATASRIVFDALRSNPKTFQQLYDYMLVKDDINTNVKDGTPNGVTIFSSFKQHGMDFNYGPFAVVADVSTTPVSSDDISLVCMGGDTDCKPTKRYYFDSDGVCSNNINDYTYSTTSNTITVSTAHSDYICLRTEDYLGDSQIFVSAQLKVISIACSSNSQCGTNGYTGSPSCSGNNVNQNYITYICNNPGTASSSCSSSTSNKLKQTCTNSCSSGSCVVPTCSSNSDCGTNGFVGSASCNGNDINQNYRTYTCNNPGTMSASCTSTEAVQLKQTCTESCSGGSCVQTACNSDAECGTDGYIGANLCSSNNVQDTWRAYKCNNPGTLSASCTSTDNIKVKEACSDVCESGSCVCHPVYTCGAWNPSICPMVINGIYFGEQARTCVDTKCGTKSISEKRKC